MASCFRFALAVVTASLLSGSAMAEKTYSVSTTLQWSEADGVRYYFSVPSGPQYAYWQFLDAMVRTAFEHSDYVLLEKTADEYRTTKSRAPLGGWNLGIFYGAFPPYRSGHLDKDDRTIGAAEQKALNWIARYPNSPTPYIVYAELLIDHGWLFRGNGYADEVTPEGWEKFRDYLAQAERVLSEHKAVASADPQWYATMLEVALGESWPATRFEPMIAEGLDRYPDYFPIYSAGATLHTPKWGGDVDALDGFINGAVARTQATSGTRIYAFIYADVDDCDCNIFSATRADWPRMRKSLAESLKAYPDPWMYDEILHFACEAGDKTTARETIANRPDAPLAGWKGDAECRAWALSPTDGPSPLQTSPSSNTDTTSIQPTQFVALAAATVTGLKLLLAIFLPLFV